MRKHIVMTNLFVKKGDTAPDRDLIYMKPLPKVLKMILPWYWDNGLSVLDVTAGKQKLWASSSLHNLDLDGDPVYHVTFLDGSPHSKTDMIGDFRQLPIKTQSQDVILFDPPFTDVKNSGERFSYNPKVVNDKQYNYKAREGRLFYFQNPFGKFVPPEVHFKNTWREFNRVARKGLIVKISERYELGYEIPVKTHMDLCYDHRFNPLSEFKRIGLIGYRGNRFKLMGARMIHPQRVLTYYAIYKKDYKVR